MKIVTKWTAIGLPVLILAFLLSYQYVSEPDRSAKLEWSAAASEDVASYDIHCWNGANQFTATIHVENPEATSYVIDDLAPGTYQCAITAIDSEGHESALSNLVTKTVP